MSTSRDYQQRPAQANGSSRCQSAQTLRPLTPGEANGLQDHVSVGPPSYYGPGEQHPACQIMYEHGELRGVDTNEWSFNQIPAAALDAFPPDAMPMGDLFPLAVNHWDTASSQLQPLHCPTVTPALPSSQQYLMHQNAPASPQTTSPAHIFDFVPIYPSQPRHEQPPQPSPLSPSSEAASSEESDLKRLRNTAASARFRVKKKLREQSLERSTQQKREKLAALEEKVRQLELENRWLKRLIIEREA